MPPNPTPDPRRNDDRTIHGESVSESISIGPDIAFPSVVTIRPAAESTVKSILRLFNLGDQDATATYLLQVLSGHKSWNTRALKAASETGQQAMLTLTEGYMLSAGEFRRHPSIKIRPIDEEFFVTIDLARIDEEGFVLDITFERIHMTDSETVARAWSVARTLCSTEGSSELPCPVSIFKAGEQAVWGPYRCGPHVVCRFDKLPWLGGSPDFAESPDSTREERACVDDAVDHAILPSHPTHVYCPYSFRIWGGGDDEIVAVLRAVDLMELSSRCSPALLATLRGCLDGNPFDEGALWRLIGKGCGRRAEFQRTLRIGVDLFTPDSDSAESTKLRRDRGEQIREDLEDDDDCGWAFVLEDVPCASGPVGVVFDAQRREDDDDGEVWDLAVRVGWEPDRLCGGGVEEEMKKRMISVRDALAQCHAVAAPDELEGLIEEVNPQLYSLKYSTKIGKTVFSVHRFRKPKLSAYEFL